MQDKYAGDIGDFGKLALLRALAPGLRFGVCWYLVEDERQNNDGRHRDYLSRPERFRKLDDCVFEALKPLRGDVTRRSVRTLEQLDLLPGAVFHHSAVPLQVSSRRAWFEEMRRFVKGCDLVFLDPDNGVADSIASQKSVSFEEISALLTDGLTLLVYHHQTRRKGGAATEATYIARQILGVGGHRVQAIRLRPYSSRFYFLVNGSDALHLRLIAFAERWGNEVELFGQVDKDISSVAE
jgi:hypothetical protein